MDRRGKLGTLVIIFVIILSLQCMYVALEKAKKAVLEKQDIQIRLLEEIKTKLERNDDK